MALFQTAFHRTIQATGYLFANTIPDFTEEGGWPISTNEIKLAYVCALANATIVGFSFLFVKQALEYAGPIDTLAYRFAVSFAAMSIAMMLGRFRLNYRGKPLYRALLLATMYPLGFFLFQTYGLQHATSSEGGILFAFVPVLTMALAAVFLKETTTVLQKLSILLSVIGVLFIFLMKGSGIALTNLLGIFLLLLSCLASAGYSVLTRSLLRVFGPLEISYLMMGIGFVVFLGLSLSNHAAAGTMDQLLAPLSSGTFLLSVLYLGVLSSLVTTLTASYALSKIEASKLSVFSNLSTVVSIAAGALVLGEVIELYHIIGSMLVIAGVWGTNHFALKKQKAQPLHTDSAKA